MARHRSHSIEFKRQIAQEFIAGEILCPPGAGGLRTALSLDFAASKHAMFAASRD
jgi:hypothetical protein